MASPVSADETDAKAILAAMSDYMTEQQNFAFDFDSTLDVITIEGRIISLTSSGTVAVDRPGHIRAARRGGFADIEMGFDGETVTLIGRQANIYSQLPIEGTIRTMIETLHTDYDLVFPAANLLMEDPVSTLMEGVTDVENFGVGVIGGQNCDHIVLRNSELDIQIWIAQGEMPRPCRYVLSTRDVALEPRYTVQINNWRNTVDPDELAIAIPEGATKLDSDALRELTKDFPDNFSVGAE
ncbi:hypothetical protein BV911_08220 [Pseudoruegeria sp. SK021]|nr:hypothetical protein BV911_08220 [Pseudoruegeria sp. SK021]